MKVLEGNNFLTSESDNRGLGALVRELQSSLYLIARHAELGGDKSLGTIMDSAQASLQIIDGYLVASQVERGQLNLNLEPMAMGSIMHDAKYDLGRTLSNDYQVEIQSKVRIPVMTHRDSLRCILVSTGLLIAEVSKSAKRNIVLRSFVTKDGDVGVGVFAPEVSLSPHELSEAIEQGGVSRLALPKHSQTSGISLQIADSLSRALGGRLHAKSLGSLSGLSTILPKSEQLLIV